MISNKIDLITFIITSLGTAVANHLKKSNVIRLCQMSKIDESDENNIRKISNEIVHNWEKMISKGGEVLEIKVDIANIGYKIDNKNLVGVLRSTYRKMAIEKRLFTLIKKAQREDNLQVCILVNIIKIQLSLNYL